MVMLGSRSAELLVVPQVIGEQAGNPLEQASRSIVDNGASAPALTPDVHEEPIPRFPELARTWNHTVNFLGSLPPTRALRNSQGMASYEWEFGNTALDEVARPLGLVATLHLAADQPENELSAQQRKCFFEDVYGPYENPNIIANIRAMIAKGLRPKQTVMAFANNEPTPAEIFLAQATTIKGYVCVRPESILTSQYVPQAVPGTITWLDRHEPEKGLTKWGFNLDRYSGDNPFVAHSNPLGFNAYEATLKALATVIKPEESRAAGRPERLGRLVGLAATSSLIKINR